MKIVRASEIGTYLYCQRAWWYAQQGYESENLTELAAGSRMHAQHGRVIATSGCLRVLAYALVLSALLLLTAAFVTSIIN
jgi:CRISPR/Cas system-associated exonuclease Cas4 (RecB family)